MAEKIRATLWFDHVGMQPDNILLSVFGKG